jgi:hypothetical protein
MDLLDLTLSVSESHPGRSLYVAALVTSVRVANPPEESLPNVSGLTTDLLVG